MTWIRIVEPTEAGEQLGRVYARVERQRGKLSNIMMVQSLQPAAMEAHLDLYMAIMFGRSGLRREEREMIAVVVSALNECEYCVRHHAAALQAYWKDEARVARFMIDFRAEDLPPRLRAVLEYAEALTCTPGAVVEEKASALRREGWADEDILAMNLVVAYFNFVNRIALGLGVEPGPDEVRGYSY